MNDGERPPLRSVLAWGLAALVGLVLAAAITIAASKLSNQRIGLAGEPLTAGDELTPARTQPVATTPASTTPASTRPSTPPIDTGERESGDD
jgi:hypothetical protein